MDKIGKIFTDNLRYWRKQRGITQEQLAEKAGLSVPGVQKAESGQRWPTPDTVTALARALEVPERFFFSAATPVMPPSPEQALEVLEGIVKQVRRLPEGMMERFNHLGPDHPGWKQIEAVLSGIERSEGRRAPVSVTVEGLPSPQPTKK